ncbi:hypothetical protein PIROE2DRAFT_1445 [Piromyces sp. E2]|nr:hypothetical protein PIROE2DRAFT_1445 [Piromyces sp. E2]|eukprot:OUM70316.1 hypothetical protein PIROE2DRAFT_1445 [Piromyces sp. E2]
MRFSTVQKIVALVSLSGLALAKSDVTCKQLKETEDLYVRECKENDNGEIVDLAIGINNKVAEDTYNKVYSLDSLQKLDITSTDVKNEYSFPLEKLTNLKDLSIEINLVDEFGYRDHYEYKITRGKIAKDGLKLPTGINKLKIEGIDLKQENVDSISALPELEDLEFRYVTTQKLNFESFAKSKKLTNLAIHEQTANLYEGYLADGVINNFKSVKNLSLSKVTLNNNIVKDISELSQLENLYLGGTVQNKLDYTPLKKLSNLTTLSINSPNLSLDYGDESGVKEIGEYNEAILNSVSHLKHLSLDYIKMSKDFVDSINTLSDLEELSIVPRHSYYDRSADQYIFDLTSFDNLEKLTSISLDGVYITLKDKDGNEFKSNGKVDFTKFKNLKKVYVNNGLTQEHVKQLATLENIEQINLDGESATKLDIEVLKSLPKLQSLIVDDKRIELVKVPVATITRTKTVTRTVPVATATSAEPVPTQQPVDPVDPVATQPVDPVDPVATQPPVDPVATEQPVDPTATVKAFESQPTDAAVKEQVPETKPKTAKRKCVVRNKKN